MHIPGVTTSTNIKIKIVNLFEYIGQVILDLIIVRKAVINKTKRAVLVAVAIAEHKVVHNDVVVHAVGGLFGVVVFSNLP